MSNIILIGMPGAGKSTIGVALALRLQRPFVDTDTLITISAGESPQAIVDSRGHLALRALEEHILSQLDYRDHVIATGGSAVYGANAMEHLRRIGTVVYLRVDLPTLEQRITNLDTRGLVRRADQTLADLFHERAPLYERYAEITIDGGGRSVDEICMEIIKTMHAWGAKP